MKFVKNFVFAALLASILAVTTFGGEQSTPGYANPTPTPTPEHMTTTDSETGDYCDPDAGSITAEASAYLCYEALVALLSLY